MLSIFIFTGNNENSCTPTVENTNIYYNISKSLLWHNICGSDYVKEIRIQGSCKTLFFRIYMYIIIYNILR